MKAPEFIGMLFLARDVAHSVHLNTRSYAKHVALNEFYTAVIEAADSFAEAWQGRHGLLGPIPLQGSKGNKPIVEFLQAQLDEIVAGKPSLAGEDSALGQLIDNVIELYLRSLYKLRFLS